MRDEIPIRDQGSQRENNSGSDWTQGPDESGWQGAEGADWSATHAQDSRCLEFCPICRTAEILRAAGPPELRGQLDDVGREALLTLKSLVDHYLERLDQRPAAEDRVERIPID